MTSLFRPLVPAAAGIRVCTLVFTFGKAGCMFCDLLGDVSALNQH